MIEIYTDGGCEPNPGTGGWAAIIIRNGRSTELLGGEQQTTNNRMEMTAVIEALRYLQDAIGPGQEVTVFTDSRYVRNGITSWIAGWKRNGWRTSTGAPVKNEDLWRQMDHLCSIHHVTFKWLKGHNGHVHNERADELAGSVIQSLRSAA